MENVILRHSNHRLHLVVPMSALLLAAFSNLLPAQQDGDPIARPITVRVVGHEDGLPRPGVPLYVHSPVPVAPVGADGWLIAESPEVRKLRAATLVHTDPEGRATLGSSPHPTSLEVGEPFFRWGNPVVNGSEWLFEVGQHEPVGVRVVDTDGQPLVGFPVALHAAGKDLSVAITDATGRAILGVPPDFTARAVIAPAGWVGPKQGFPSVAESLAGRRHAELTVPPHGSLRIRAVRNGEPVRGEMHAVGFFDPQSSAPLAEPANASAREAIGLFYPRVALGIELAGYMPIPRVRAGMLHCTTPGTAGTCATVDVELGPLLTFGVTGLAAGESLVTVQALLVTDAETLDSYLQQESDGSFVLDPGRALLGQKLQRIDVDVDVGRPTHRSGTLLVEQALPCGSLRLGEVRLTQVEPQLRGVVHDEQGQPVTGVQVAISSNGQPNTGHLLTTDAEGRFVSSAAIARDADGKPIQLFASARAGERISETVRGVDGEVQLTLRARTPVEQPKVRQKGVLVARLRGIEPTGELRMRFLLVSRVGQFQARAADVEADGTVVVRFENLRAGSFALCVPGPDGTRVRVLDALEVPGDGECQDARLRDFDCRAAMHKVTVRVLDAQGVPVAGAYLNGPEFARVTDGTGTAALWVGRDQPLAVVVSAPGSRQKRIDSWPGQQDVRLEPAGRLQVVVRGLPSDLPRGQLEVWMREEGGESFAGPRARLRDGDLAEFELPARGGYLPILIVTRPNARGSGSSSTAVHVATTPVQLADAPAERIEIVVSEAELTGLREELAR